MDELKPYWKALLWTLMPGFVMGTYWVLGSPEYGHKSLTHTWNNLLPSIIVFTLIFATPTLIVCAFINRRSLVDFCKLVAAMFGGGYLVGLLFYFVPVSNSPLVALLGSLILVGCAAGALGGIWIVRKFFSSSEPGK